MGLAVDYTLLKIGTDDIFVVSLPDSSTANGGLRYFSRAAGVIVQYRWMGVDYEKGTRGTPRFFEFDSTMHGVVIGLSFSW